MVIPLGFAVAAGERAVGDKPALFAVSAPGTINHMVFAGFGLTLDLALQRTIFSHDDALHFLHRRAILVNFTVKAEAKRVIACLDGLVLEFLALLLRVIPQRRFLEALFWAVIASVSQAVIGGSAGLTGGHTFPCPSERQILGSILHIRPSDVTFGRFSGDL